MSIRSGLAALALACAGASPAFAQNDYQPPRTPDGRPDLQGTWTNASITTLERADRYKSTTLTPEEVEQATRDHPQLVRIRTEDIANTPATGLLTGRDLLMGRGYNAFWIDPGTRFGVVRGQIRTAWITDPPDGKIPWSEAGRKLAHAGDERLGYSDPEARPLPDRCLATGGRTGPPMVNGLYNNHYQIVQTPGHVLIHTEMISHARIVPISGKHQPAAIAPLFGDSIGRWEGDTLVIETTSFNNYHSWQDHPAYLSAGPRSPNASRAWRRISFSTPSRSMTRPTMRSRGQARSASGTMARRSTNTPAMKATTRWTASCAAPAIAKPSACHSIKRTRSSRPVFSVSIRRAVSPTSWSGAPARRGPWP
jgi:hypothetical protein